MEDTKSISFRLESFMLQLSDVNRRWTQWLSASELAASGRAPERLQALEPVAAELFQELRQVLAAREKLLDDARHIGLPCKDLNSLARRLPAWKKPSLRASMARARQQLSNLQRLHISTWVLINQALHFYNDSLQLMMAGSLPHVYMNSNETVTCAGRLLDTKL